MEAVRNIFFVRRGEDSGQKQLDANIIKARTYSYEKHLTNYGVNPEDYEKVYELAIQIYVDEGIKGPFGIDDILKGAKALKNIKENFKSYEFEKVNRNSCSYCKGTSLKYDDKGKIIYKLEKGKKIAERCDKCYENKN